MGNKVLCATVQLSPCDSSKTITSCITIFAATMSTDGECVRRVTDFRFGDAVAVASAEVMETPAEVTESQRMCSTRSTPVGNICLIRKLGSICIRRHVCIDADKSLTIRVGMVVKGAAGSTNQRSQPGHPPCLKSCIRNLKYPGLETLLRAVLQVCYRLQIVV